MPVTFNQLIRETALRVNAIVGPQASGLEVNYITNPLTAAQFRSADFPFTSFKDTALLAEEAFAEAIASNRKSQYRSFINPGLTSNIVSGAPMPSINSSGNPVIGVFGAIVDQADPTIVLTEKPLALVRRIKAETWRVYLPYYFAFDGNVIVHTRTFVLANCCTYNRITRQTAIDASLNASTLLPDALEPFVVAMMVSLLVKDGVYADQGALYGARANAKLAELRGLPA